jgi:hypothetical protein
MAVDDWSTTPELNTAVGPVNIAENCPPGNMNASDREIMAQVKAKFDAIAAATPGAGQPADPTLTAFAALVTAADKMIYATGLDSFALTDTTAFGRSLLALVDIAALRLAIGGITLVSASITPIGHIKLNVGASTFTMNWGSGTKGPDTSLAVSYQIPFTTFAIPVSSGSPSDVSKEGGPGTSAAGLSSFTVTNTTNVSVPFWWIGVGS